MRLARETEALERRVAGRSHVIARTFDRVCRVLERLGYLTGDTVTPDGQRLGRLYTELDLLAAECLRRGLWDDLSPAELAACVSALSFESRQADDVQPPRLPKGRVPEALGRHRPHLGRARPAGEGQRPVVPARARPRLRLGRLPLGARRAAGERPRRGARPHPRRLRPVRQAAHRPAGPDRLGPLAEYPLQATFGPSRIPPRAARPTAPAAPAADLGATARAAIDALRRGVITLLTPVAD